jgi:hypothetical protein
MKRNDPLAVYLESLKSSTQHSECDRELSYLRNAWKKHSEFQDALHCATVGLMEPLANYLASTKPLTEDDRCALAGFVLSLQKRRRGRPRNITKPASPDAHKAKHEATRDANHNAAYLVRLSQQAWRDAHGGKRVPRKVTEELIIEAIEAALKSFGVTPNRNELRRLVAKKHDTTTAEK